MKINAAKLFSAEFISQVKLIKKIFGWQWLKARDENGKIIFIEYNQ